MDGVVSDSAWNCNLLLRFYFRRITHRPMTTLRGVKKKLLSSSLILLRHLNPSPPSPDMKQSETLIIPVEGSFFRRFSQLSKSTVKDACDVRNAIIIIIIMESQFCIFCSIKSKRHQQQQFSRCMMMMTNDVTVVRCKYSFIKLKLRGKIRERYLHAK